MELTKAGSILVPNKYLKYQHVGANQKKETKDEIFVKISVSSPYIKINI
jgi:hypothetical protein